MPLDLNRARARLAEFNFDKLFIEELGWSNPASKQPRAYTAKGTTAASRQIAQLGGVVVCEVNVDGGTIPDAKTRAALHKEIAAHHHENLLIFVDAQRTQSLWYWVRRDQDKVHPRDHFFVKGQPGDLFLSKLASLVVDISELDAEGNIGVVEVASRLKNALDVERVTKKFYTEFQQQHLAFLELITGIADERDRRWYASVLLNRLMFIYFLQRKFFLDNGDEDYLQNKLAEMQGKGRDLYYEKFLKTLFFEGFAEPEEKRSPAANKLLGKIKYLNGGLFLRHSIEQRHPKIAVPDKAFADLFALFERYSWNLNDTPGGADNEINPDVLGYIFEKYINQKAFGAYYTRPEITEYLCERTIHRLILDAVKTSGGKGGKAGPEFDTIGDLLINLDASLCKKLIEQILPDLRLLDPACGSAAFLVAAMRTLINVYAAVIGKIEFLGHRGLTAWLDGIRKKHPSVNYYIKKTIITENLFGVDIMEEAVEIAKLRLFLALVAAANTVDDLEPLPNIEFNVMTGNSLIGLLQVADADFDKYAHDLASTAVFKDYRAVLAEKNELVGLYRRATSFGTDLQSLRDGIEVKKRVALTTLNLLLLDQFQKLGIRFEQATWDEKKNAEGKAAKRALANADIEALKPFHWGFEFDEIINQRGGFDAIITNPPWEIFKPNAKEFFEEFSDLVTKKKMTIHEFEKAQAKLLKDPDIRQAYCGIVIPSGIYTDLGAKQLRELLFSQAEVTGLFCFENRKGIFENVDSRFKFLVLTFEKGCATRSCPAAFMRHDVAELERFPQEGAMDISVDLVRRLSPDSPSATDVAESRNLLWDVLATEGEARACYSQLVVKISEATRNTCRHEPLRESVRSEGERLRRQLGGTLGQRRMAKSLRRRHCVIE